jgi:hypothetical protein
MNEKNKTKEISVFVTKPPKRKGDLRVTVFCFDGILLGYFKPVR